MKIDGKQLANEIKDELAIEVQELTRIGQTPMLAVVLVGNDHASQIYVRNKERACERVGIKSQTYRLPEDTSESEILSLVETLNESSEVDGILVQVPLPNGLNEEKIINSIAIEKDVDGFLPESSGNLYLGMDGFVPCTANGIIELIKSTGESIDGKNAVVVGRSSIVGKPTAMLLLQNNATVTICHSHTKNLAEITKNADILVVAIGKAKFVRADMVKQGAIVIDVGMDRDNGKLCGDVDFENVKDVAKYITPVPGGVGPMTITMLLKNTIKSRKMRMKN